ncbi:MAG: hypothetical protein WAM42_22955 [Candidatus Nitrosopolaris sp.]
MAFYAARYRIRTEPFFREQKIRRFSLLKEKIFSKLRDKHVMEDGYHDELSTFKLGYDLTEIKSSSYYAEASEYIKKDLPSPLTTPEDLEKLVTKFNNDIDG